MNRAAWMQCFQDAPLQVQEYVLSDGSLAAEDAAREKLGFDHDVWERVMSSVWDLVFLRVPEKDFRSQLERVIGDHVVEDVERMVLRHVVLPLADLVPWDVERRLQELGFPLSELQAVNRVALRPVSYGAAVRRMAAQAKVTLLSEDIVKRCRDILVSYIKGVRLMEQVKEMLARNQRDGGVGFSAAQVDVFVSVMVDFLSKTEVLSEQAYADWFTTFQRQIVSDRMTEKQSAAAPLVAPNPVASEADVLPGAAISQRTIDAKAVLQQAVDDTYASLGFSGQDPYLQSRVQTLISSRLRDVRNTFQIKDVLMRDPKVGGVGLVDSEAERITDRIEAGYAEHREAILAEEKQKIVEVEKMQAERMAERKVRESEAHADWFAKKIQTTQKDDDARRDFFVQMKNAASVQTQFGSDSAPSHAPPMSVDSVFAPPRLVGLTEELEDMTVEMFRRMARVPDEAAKKIVQKLDALHEESFERYTAGVQSWRASPLQQAYLNLVGESFRAGQSVIELINLKRKSDPLILTADEVGAILAINGHAQL